MILQDITKILPVHPDKSYRKRSLVGITDLIVHHSASTVPLSPGDIARMHIKKGGDDWYNKGWPGIGYHVFIDRAGIGYLCNYWDVLSYHCSKMNTKSIGICVDGNFMVESPSVLQIYTLSNTLKYLRGLFPQTIVSLHCDHKPTLCPGEKLVQYLKYDKWISED